MPEFLPSACPSLAWLLLGYALTASGCAFFHKDNAPDVELRARIFPALDYQPVKDVASPNPPIPPKAEPLPMPREVGGEEAEDHTAASPLASPEALPLDRAIELAFQYSPTLELMRERIVQAQGGRQVAFADFLPQTKTSYRHIAGETNVGTFGVPTLPTYVGVISYGGQADQFNMAELNVQWILWDFGRTPGRYGQAVTQVEIARLQFERARQSVAFNVAVAYFQVLQAHALQVIAAESVRRAESVLRDSRNFLKRGVGIRNDVVRADVFLAEMRLTLVKARTAEGIAIAGLNQAIGINVSSPTHVIDLSATPPFDLALGQCLQMAADNREEFGVVLRSIRSARLGTGVAQAEFLPRVLVGGAGVHLDAPGLSDANLIAGGLNIELPLFEGGRRVGKLRTAEADVRAAVAAGKEICDRIAYEVQTAFLLIDDARQRIALSQTAVAGATENLRVVRSLFEKGDATPTDVVDGELAMIRAQQDYSAARYDYQTALVRLAYAVGRPMLTDFTTPLGGPCP
jgi:outer membrane protein